MERLTGILKKRIILLFYRWVPVCGLVQQVIPPDNKGRDFDVTEVIEPLLPVNLPLGVKYGGLQ
ncbi:MAG: hypothetical protein KAU06_00060 [Candidatus Marinimicrobia bacterium]|nr:hypothetical protein [Candidatus Neomarinimicrobiota bacterium]